MTAKEYLRQLWNLDKEIEIKCKELERLRAQIGIACLPDNQDHVIGSGCPQDQVADTVIRIVQLEDRITSKLHKLIQMQTKITNQIDAMDNRVFRNLLTCRYVLMQNWEEVADSLGYSTQNCYLIHGKALQEFYRLYLKP